MKKWQIFFSIIVLVLLNLLIPKTVGKTLVFDTVWATSYNLDAYAVSSDVSGFKTDKELLFLGSDGQLQVYERIAHEAAMGSAVYFNYQKDEEMLLLKDYKGDTIRFLETAQLPVLLGTRMFLVSNTFNQLHELNLQVDELWSRQFPSIITSLSATQNLLAVGLLNGQFYLIDPTGADLFQYSDWQSEISVVYGVAISDEEDRLAVLAGLNPQVLMIFDYDHELMRFRINFELIKSTENRSESYLEFNKDASVLFHASYNAVKFLDIASRKVASFPISSSLISVGQDLPLSFNFWQDEQNLYLWNTVLDYVMEFPAENLTVKNAWNGLVFLAENSAAYMEITGY